MSVVRIGIDFGTTYSFAGFLHGDYVMPLIPSKETYGIPSIFYYYGRTKLVGRMAERRAQKEPQNVVRSIKRRLDEKEIEVGGKKFTSEEIVKEIISYVVECAEEQLTNIYMEEYDEMEAVITVPVDFSEAMKSLIRSAAEKVTLKNGRTLRITGMIPEPVAAAIEYFGIKKEKDANILVFDLGGGTFDVALVRAHAQGGVPYEVLDQDGDKALGGDDWDRELAKWIAKLYQEETGDKKVEQLMPTFIQSAREIKEELTSMESSSTSISVTKGDYFDVKVSRSEFERLTKPLLQRVLEKVNLVTQRQSDKPIDHVILTGGSSYMPQVKDALVQMFGSKMDIRLIEPEHAISYGGARYAATRVWDEIEEEVVTKEKIIDLISSHSYGIIYNYDKLGKTMIRILIPKGSKLPISTSTISMTSRENQMESAFRVCESDYSGDKKLIEVSQGRVIMTATMKRSEKRKPIPKGTECMDTLSLSEDELLTVHSVDKVSGAETKNSVSVKRHV